MTDFPTPYGMAQEDLVELDEALAKLRSAAIALRNARATYDRAEDLGCADDSDSKLVQTTYASFEKALDLLCDWPLPG